MAASMQQHLMRGRQEYGPRIGSGPVSPTGPPIGAMVLPLEAIQPHLPPPLAEPSSTRVEDYSESNMRELCAKTDEVAALKAHIRNAEAPASESQQRGLRCPWLRKSALAPRKVLGSMHARILNRRRKPVV